MSNFHQVLAYKLFKLRALEHSSRSPRECGGGRAQPSAMFSSASPLRNNYHVTLCLPNGLREGAASLVLFFFLFTGTSVAVFVHL